MYKNLTEKGIKNFAKSLKSESSMNYLNFPSILSSSIFHDFRSFFFYYFFP